MKYLAVFLFLLAFASVLAADDSAVSGGEWATEEFLGYAVPRPQPYDSIFVAFDQPSKLRDTTVTVRLVVTDRGRTKKAEIVDAQDDTFDPIKKPLEKLRFDMSDGERIGKKLTLPLRVSILRSLDGPHFVRVRFPFGPDGYSDTTLVKSFFALNGIQPPDIETFPGIFYHPQTSDSNFAYPVIVAAVRVSADGTLEDIAFPVPGCDKNTHPVQAALMSSRYKPGIHDGKTRIATLYIVFRFFDNLPYPINPLSPRDSTSAPLPNSVNYFMRRQFSPSDLSCPPVIRFPGDGLLPFSDIRGRGSANMIATLDSAGYVSRVSLRSVSEAFRGEVQKLMRRTNWYPAMDKQGRFVEYTGQIMATVRLPIYIVISPEWQD
jgi:hypothetical protein